MNLFYFYEHLGFWAIYYVPLLFLGAIVVADEKGGSAAALVLCVTALVGLSRSSVRLSIFIIKQLRYIKRKYNTT
jgi:hypothetical protein